MDVTAFERTGRMDGQCLCGAVTVVVNGAYVAAVGACHCAMCRRWAGTVMSGFDVEAGAVTVTGEVARYASSDFAERAFCPRCGSHLWFRDTDVAGKEYEFMPGLFEGARDFPLISEIYMDRAPGYARLAGDHVRRDRADYEAGTKFVEGDDPCGR